MKKQLLILMVALLISCSTVVHPTRPQMTVRPQTLTMAGPDAYFHVVARDRQGRIVWTRDTADLLTTIGCNDLLTEVFGLGTVATWYVGEIKAYTSFNIADTMASHSGWTEEASGTTDINNGTRPSLTVGAPSGTSTVTVTNSGTPAVFNQNSSITVTGFYLVSNNSVGGTSGDLYGEGEFSSGAVVASGYTLTVTVTLSASAG